MVLETTEHIMILVDSRSLLVEQRKNKERLLIKMNNLNYYAVLQTNG